MKETFHVIAYRAPKQQEPKISMASPVTCMGSSTWTTLLFRDKQSAIPTALFFTNLQKSDNNTNRVLLFILFWSNASHPHPYPSIRKWKWKIPDAHWLPLTSYDFIHTYSMAQGRAFDKGLVIVAILPRKLLNRETSWTYVQLVDLTGLRVVSILTPAVFQEQQVQK